MAIAYCWRTGVIEIGRRVPSGALKLVEAHGTQLRRAVSALACHTYEGGVLLVPGVPEAKNDVDALEAAKRFRDGILGRLVPKNEAHP